MMMMQSIWQENYQKNLEYSNRVYKIERRNLKLNVLFQPVFNSITAVATIIAYGVGSYYMLNKLKPELHVNTEETTYI